MKCSNTCITCSLLTVQLLCQRTFRQQHEADEGQNAKHKCNAPEFMLSQTLDHTIDHPKYSLRVFRDRIPSAAGSAHVGSSCSSSWSRATRRALNRAASHDVSLSIVNICFSTGVTLETLHRIPRVLKGDLSGFDWAVSPTREKFHIGLLCETIP